MSIEWNFILIFRYGRRILLSLFSAKRRPFDFDKEERLQQVIRAGGKRSSSC